MSLPRFFQPPQWVLLALFIGTMSLPAGCSQPAAPPLSVSDASEDTLAADTLGIGEFVFSPEPPPVYAYDGFRLATLNTAFMFDGYGDEGQADFPHRGNPARARLHRDRIGEIIRMLDADIIMLAEVENEEVLQMLIRESLKSMNYQAYFIQGTDRFTGQDMAMLSRISIEKINRTDERAPVGTSDDTYGVSKNLYARLYVNNLPVTLIGIHLLARPDDPSRKSRREAQAEVIRRLVQEEAEAGRAVVVMGDFNDFDSRVADLYDNQPITDVLQRIKSGGPDPADDLLNVMARAPRRERYTAFYDRNQDDKVGAGELSAIDHILLSPELYRRVRDVQYVQTYDPAVYTDHFPVVVTLDMN